MTVARAEQYLQYLKATIGIEAEIIGVETDNNDAILVAVCPNYPEVGLTTGLTYGLSEAQHDDWRKWNWKPELAITVASTETEWLLAAAHLIDSHRHTSSFAPGSLFDLGNIVHPESEMQAFLVFNLTIDTPKHLDNIILGDNDAVKVLGLYPLYVGEVAMLHKVGMRKFFELPEYRLFSINRPDLSAIYKLNDDAATGNE